MALLAGGPPAVGGVTAGPSRSRNPTETGPPACAAGHDCGCVASGLGCVPFTDPGAPVGTSAEADRWPTLSLTLAATVPAAVSTAADVARPAARRAVVRMSPTCACSTPDVSWTAGCSANPRAARMIPSYRCLLY